MRIPLNSAAELVRQAESTITDLKVQAGEIQAAISRQEATVASLDPVAEWETVPDDPPPAPAPEDPDSNPA